MSADNGIYIAHFPDGTMRVAYASDSVIYEIDSHCYSPEEAKDAIEEIFGGSPVFTDSNLAVMAAQAEDDGDTEYGVCQIYFSANFGELRDVIPEPELPEGACVHCSHPGGTVTMHGAGDECDRDPSTPSFMVRMMLREKFYGMNEYIVAREVMEVLNEHFNIEPKPALTLTVVQ